MKKQTQSQLAPYWSKLADGSMVHGLGTYKPPPVHLTDNSVQLFGNQARIGEGVVININLGAGANFNSNSNASDTSNLPNKRFGPPSKKKVSDNTRNVFVLFTIVLFYS